MRSRISLLVAFLCAGLLTGCIEFESQTVAYCHELASDTLKIYQNYHGIFGGDNSAKLTAEEQEQLDSVLNGQRTFFFANWISEISHNQLRDKLKKFKDPQYQTDQKLDAAAVSHLETLINLLLEHVRVENGSWYQNQQGKLAGVQRVTVRHVSKIIEAGNAVIRDALKSEAAAENTTLELKSLYSKSIEHQTNYIRLEGNRITVHFPATRQQFEEMTTADKTSEAIQLFKKQGGTVNFTNDTVMVSFGQAADKVTSLTMNVSEKKYSTNLLETIRKRSLLHSGSDPSLGKAEFLAEQR